MGLEKINFIRKQKGITIEQLSKNSGVPLSTIKKICAGITINPNLDTVKAIAKALNCKLDDFDDNSILKEEWKRHELDHIKKYRLLSPKGQQAIDKTLDAILELEEQSQPSQVQNNIIHLRISEQSASAGSGTYLGPESFETIRVVENDLIKQAAFAVPISGDSMEPKYHDGDIILISKDIPEIGETGLFTLNGNGYVKKLGNGELISLNHNYDPIPMDESIICNGKVIGVLDNDLIIDE